MVDELIHHASCKTFLGRIQHLLHVVVKWFHSFIRVALHGVCFDFLCTTSLLYATNVFLGMWWSGANQGNWLPITQIVAHKTCSTSSKQYWEYMMFPKIDKTFDCFSTLTIFLIAFWTHTLQTCHMHKNVLALRTIVLYRGKI